MLKRILLFAAFGQCFMAQGQSFLEITTGPGYQNQQFIRLKDDFVQSAKLTDWDIAFTSFGQQDAGVHFNEASGTSMGQAQPEIEVYDTKSTDFAKVFNVDSIKANRLYNDEKSWSYGAFNSNRNPASPFDFGWGKYAPATNSVAGDKVFVIKLKNGQFKKFTIISLGVAGYNFKYADLNGDNLVTKTKAKTFGTQSILYYSFAKEDFVVIAPSSYDLVYSRYTSIAQDPNSPLLAQYNVTGVLTAPGNSTARVVSVSPETELPKDTTTYTKRQDVIGYDWKTFTNVWSINTNLVYFVKSQDLHIYKLRFIDFEGASTGNATIEKTDLGVLSSTRDLLTSSVNVYPNPASSNVDVVFDAIQNVGASTLQIIDLTGKQVMTLPMNVTKGLNAFNIDITTLNAGLYKLHITSAQGILASQKIVKI